MKLSSLFERYGMCKVFYLIKFQLDMFFKVLRQHFIVVRLGEMRLTISVLFKNDEKKSVESRFENYIWRKKVEKSSLRYL